MSAIETVPSFRESSGAGLRPAWFTPSAILAFTFFLLILLSPQAFTLRNQDVGHFVGLESDVGNQVSFLLTLVFAAYVIFRGRAWSNLFTLLTPSFLVLYAWCFLTVFVSDVPELAFRRFAFNAVVFATAAGTLAAEEAQGRRMIGLWLLLYSVAVITNYATAILFPDFGRHVYEPLERDIVGSWRGLHVHKNVAGFVMGTATIQFLWTARNEANGRKRRMWYTFALASVVFIGLTRSKTTLIMTVLSVLGGAVICRALRARIGLDLFLAAACTAAATVLLILFGTFGSVDRLLLAVFGDATLTGRTLLWAFLWRYVEQYPWFGSGFGSFFAAGTASPLLETKESFSMLAHAHNGYLQMAVTTGLPGMLLSIVALVISPLRQVFSGSIRSTYLLSLFVPMWLFGLGENLLEGWLMGASQPGWVFVLVPVLAIRMVASGTWKQLVPPGVVSQPRH